MFHPSCSHLAPAARRLLLAACFAATPVFLLAQQPSAPPATTQDQAPPQPGMQHGARGAEMQQRQLDHLTKSLSLTPDQVTQVKAIQDDGRQQRMALHQNTSLSQDDRRNQIMTLHQAETTSIEGILSPEQKTKFDAMRAKMEQRRDEHRGAEQAAPPPPPAN